jgi:hypothetical protein
MKTTARLISSLSLAASLLTLSSGATAAGSFEAVPTDTSATVLLKRLAAKEGVALRWQMPRDYKIGNAERFNTAAGLDDAKNFDDAVGKVLALLNKNRPEDRPAFACRRTHGKTPVVVVSRTTPCHRK